MGLFGKILMGINILAAIIFFVVSGLDYSKRTDGQYQVLRGELILNGLPLDDKDQHFRNPDDALLVRDLNKNRKLLAETFSGASGGSQLGGEPTPLVITLTEEVTRVKGKVTAAVDGAANEDAKRTLLRGFLLDQVRDGQTRDELARKLADPRTPSDELKEELMRLIDEAAAPGVPTAPLDSPKTEDDKQLKREQIAHLLIHLAPRDLDWQQRVAAVVGLKTYVPVLNRQAAALSAMADRARLILRRDQSTFLAEYQALLSQLRTEADRLADADRRLAREKDLLNEQMVILSGFIEVDDPKNPGQKVKVPGLRLRVAQFEKDLADKRAETTRSLTQQAAMEQQIFDVLAETVRTQDAIRRTEQRLRELEQQARPR